MHVFECPTSDLAKRNQIIWCCMVPKKVSNFALNVNVSGFRINISLSIKTLSTNFGK